MKPEFRKVTNGITINMAHVILVVDHGANSEFERDQIEIHMTRDLICNTPRGVLAIEGDDAAKFRAYLERQAQR